MLSFLWSPMYWVVAAWQLDCRLLRVTYADGNESDNPYHAVLQHP